MKKAKKTSTRKRATQKSTKGITLDKDVQPVKDAFQLLIDTDDIGQAVAMLVDVYNSQEN